MEKKMTKKEMFGLLLGLLETVEVAEKEDLKEFVAHEIELITKKAEKSKDYKRKKEVDVLKGEVAACLSDEYRTTADIVEDLLVDYPDMSSAKVTARLTALVKEGVAVKESIKVGSRKLMGYKVA